MIGPGVYQYDSRATLKGRDARLAERHIGVSVSEPFHSRGLNVVCVEVTRYTLIVSGVAAGYVFPAETAKEETRSATERTVAELDAVIAELTAHRDRLCAELKVIDEFDWARLGPRASRGGVTHV